ncbi:hypothetical protein BBJ28_00027248, partial [Nothophytophthora sp. Chile5]
MAGFVRVEEDGERQRQRSLSTSSPCSPSMPQGKASGKAKVFSRWLYGVLQGDVLKLYWRRTDYKRKTPPLDQLALQMQPAAANESVFGFDHECLYVRAKDSGRVIALRIHQRKEIVRWVTALYYQSLGSGSANAAAIKPAASKHHSTTSTSSSARSSRHTKHAAGASKPAPPEADEGEDKALAPRSSRKSVSFQEEPQVVVLPQQAYDPADLYYSEDDYEQFLMERPSHLSS